MDQTAPEHTAEAAASWLASNRLDDRSARSAAEIDRQIQTERDCWDKPAGH